MRLQVAVRVFLLVATLHRVSLAQEQIEAQVSVAVAEPGSLGRTKTALFSVESKPGANRKLQVLVHADGNAQVMVVGFDDRGQLAYHGMPVLDSLAAHDTLSLPRNNQGWPWKDASSIRELFVVLLGEKAPALIELRSLVQALQSDVPDAVRRLQLKNLQVQIDAFTQRSSEVIVLAPRPTPVTIGGGVRGECEWCKNGQNVKFRVDGSYVIRQQFP